jgi:hypothetical protein
MREHSATTDSTAPGFTLRDLQRTLADIDPGLQAADPAADQLQRLNRVGLDRLPYPGSGSGSTLLRWQALAAVARHDLSLAKLYEGHTDALAILHELGAPRRSTTETTETWGVWAAESAQERLWLQPAGASAQATLAGSKFWCSGAAAVTHGLLTAWVPDEPQPQLVWVDMRQPGIHIDARACEAVGMRGSTPVDIRFDGVAAQLVGSPGQYLARPGFWHGGAGVAACWFGGALALADVLRSAVVGSGADPQRFSDFKRAACGKVDVELRATAALLREVAAWIDSHPVADAQAQALRARLTAERCATRVLDEVGRALGAAPFCRNGRFARAAADLPVFIRQSHAERDYAALGQHWAVPETTIESVTHNDTESPVWHL